MQITKQKGIIISEYIIDMMNCYLSDDSDLYASIETFYNCREQGYVLEVHSLKDYDKSICIWICAQRNSDDPMIVWEETRIPQENANMFTEDSYYNRNECFTDIKDATEKAVNIIENYFNINC